jgi:hypothetical protein
MHFLFVMFFCVEIFFFPSEVKSLVVLLAITGVEQNVFFHFTRSLSWQIIFMSAHWVSRKA